MYLRVTPRHFTVLTKGTESSEQVPYIFVNLYSKNKNKTCFNLEMNIPQCAEVTSAPSGFRTVVGACLQIPRDASLLLQVLLFKTCVYHNQLRHQLKDFFLNI